MQTWVNYVPASRSNNKQLMSDEDTKGYIVFFIHLGIFSLCCRERAFFLVPPSYTLSWFMKVVQSANGKFFVLRVKSANREAFPWGHTKDCNGFYLRSLVFSLKRTRNRHVKAAANGRRWNVLNLLLWKISNQRLELYYALIQFKKY